MKLTLKLLVLMAFSISASAELSEQQQQQKNQEKVRASLYDGYEIVAAAWNLNSRCKLLSESESKEFDWYTAQFTMIVASFQNDEKIIAVQKSALATSKQEKLEDCGSEAKKNVLAGLVLSQNIVKKLTTSKYDEIRKNIAQKTKNKK
jgi:tryptophan 2,3-dioxygenase